MGLLQPAAADSPFRTAATIRRAWARFMAQEASTRCARSRSAASIPGKMWVVDGDRMSPLLPAAPAGQPWHSTPYQALPPVYVQNASLEIAWTRVVFERRTIAGDVLVPFLTEGHEGFDINDRDRLDGGRAADCRRRGDAAGGSAGRRTRAQWANSNSTR